MRLYFFFIIIFIAELIKAQGIVDHGSYIINSYSPDDYNASTQIFSITQDQRGLMYFGNMNGLIEFDGTNWKIYELSNKSLPNAIATDKNGKIFIGATNEIGYLSTCGNGEGKYVSLLKYLPEEERSFNNIIKVLTTTESVGFFTREKIYFYKNDTITIFKPDLPTVYPYSIFDHFILVNRTKGIYIYRNNNIVLLPHSFSIIENNGIYELLEYDEDNILIMTEKGGACLYNLRNILKTIDENNNIRYDFEYDELIRKLPTSVHHYLNRYTLTESAKLNENLFAFGTLKGGVILMDKHGNIDGVLNKNRGLNDNAASDLFADKDGDLWIGMNFGVAHVETSVPFREYEEIYGLDDAVLSTIDFNNKRYFGTMNGVFELPNITVNELYNKPQLKRVHNIEFSAWDLIDFKGNLFTTGESGIYQINENKGKELISSTKAYIFEPSAKFENHLFLGLVNGLALVEVKNNKNDFASVKIINEFKDFNKSVRKIVNDKHGNIWLTTQYSSVFYIRFGESPLDYEIFNFDTLHGLPNPDFNYIHLINDKILVTTEDGLFKYVGPEIITELIDSVLYFMPDSTYDIFYKKDSLSPYNIHIVNDSLYWIHTEYLIGKLTKQQNKLIWNDSLTKGIPPAYYTFYDTSGVLWICGARGITRYNTNFKKNINTPYNTLIRKIYINKDSLIFNGFNCVDDSGELKCYSNIDELKSVPVEFDFKYNSLEFQYTANFFEHIDKIHYRFKLQGFDKSWSSWTNVDKKEYTNLNEGHYTFLVKAKNVYGVESNIAEYSFRIKPPWYRTILAYFSYAVLLALLFIIGIRLNSKRLKAANLRLEEIVRKRTEEIRKQKEELEKLSIVASETDNAVIIMDATGNIEWVNDAFTRMYGYTQDELFNIKGKNIVNASANVYIKEVLNSVIHNKESIIYESMFVSKEGEKIWVQTTLTPILNSLGNVIKLVAIDTDIGKLKTAEEEISQQKEELQTQSELLEETNIELERTNLLITDSIKYAKLIQDAILPRKDEITDEFPESFIFYQPKSIVSGDFYWIAHSGDKIFLALVDCTGHGVPGAFMSLIGSILLNEIINDKKLYNNPAVILDRLNKGVINALGQTGKREEIQDDGMDMTLLVIDKNAKKMNLALANHNVYFYRGNELTTIEGDIFSIGGVLSKSSEVKFTNHEYKIDNGDIIYMFSDGFQDQFGGEFGKKYMATRFKNFINQIHNHPMQIQEHKMKNEFKSWQGHEKQVDDVLVIGLKFNDL